MRALEIKVGTGVLRGSVAGERRGCQGGRRGGGSQPEEGSGGSDLQARWLVGGSTGAAAIGSAKGGHTTWARGSDRIWLRSPTAGRRRNMAGGRSEMEEGTTATMSRWSPAVVKAVGDGCSGGKEIGAMV